MLYHIYLSCSQNQIHYHNFQPDEESSRPSTARTDIPDGGEEEEDDGDIPGQVDNEDNEDEAGEDDGEEEEETPEDEDGDAAPEEENMDDDM